jgi:hypothetical protein
MQRRGADRRCDTVAIVTTAASQSLTLARASPYHPGALAPRSTRSRVTPIRTALLASFLDRVVFLDRSHRFVCAVLAALAVLVAAPAFAQLSPYKIAEAELAIDGLSAEVEGASPVVPRNIASGLRVIVRAGGRALSPEEAVLFLGPGFEVRAELAGPGLRQAVSLPPADLPPSDDRLLLRLPSLAVAGDYTISGLRIGAGSRTLLDVAPRQLTLRVIEQVLITSVQTRPLTLAELQDKGVLLDDQSYLGFEFTIGLLLESRPIRITLPVAFNREGVPTPPVIPLPPPIGRDAPLIVPMLFSVVEDGEDGGDGDADGGPPPPPGGDFSAFAERIPSVMVIPGNVGYLKQHFSAQLFVANGAPTGSNLRVRDIAGTIHLPPGADTVPGTADDPLVLAPLVDRTPSAVLPVRGVGADGEPGTADDVAELVPGALGQAEFLLRGEREGFHSLSFDIAAVLDGLPTGAVNVTGHAKGGVLVRNAMFDMTFAVPNVVRVGERFKLVAIVNNIGRGDAYGLSVTIDQARMSGLQLRGEGTVSIPFLRAGDARTVEFEFDSQRTGRVVASYLHFDTGGNGRLNFTIGIGERGVPLSPDTLVLPTSVDGLPPDVVAAAMRVLGQAWSVATAPADRMSSSVLPMSPESVWEKAIALSEAGLRVQLGQPAADAVRDLAFDFYGGKPLDPGFDQLLRETEAGRNLAFKLGAALASAASAAGGPASYERAASEIAASGADFVAVSVRGTGGPVGAILSDSAGRRTVLGRSTAADDLPLSQIPGAAFLPLGAPASAPTFGLIAAPTLPPYTLTASGPAELSVTFPRGNGVFQRGTVITSHPARVVMDFGSPRVDEDTNGDGTYDTPRQLVLETLTSQGPRVVSATVLGPETLRAASDFGLNAALLFDRVVAEESAAEKGRYQIPDNEVLSAKRQLSGRLVFLGLAQPEGNHVTTRVSVSGLADTRGVVGPSGTVALTSRLQNIGAVVSGRVVNADGTPFTQGLVYYLQYLTNLQLWPCDGSTPQAAIAAVRPDADGRYEFRYVRRDPCGFPFEMTVYDPVTGARRTAQLYVRTAGEQMVADLAMLGRGTVTGIVRDAADQPVGGARVAAYSVTDATVGGQDLTDGSGRYTIRNITVGGVNVRVSRGLYLGQAAGRIERTGATATINVRLEGGSARISGRVFKLEDGHSTPAPGLHVRYYMWAGTYTQLLGVAQTDAQGRYALEGMPAGNFNLTAHLNSRDFASIDSHADEGQVVENLDLVITVPPEAQRGSVQGTVRYRDGQPAPGVLVYVNERGALSGTNGGYEIDGLLVPSNPTVMARSRDGLRTGTANALLTASNPRPTGIDITLSGDGNAEFTVLGPDGAPIEGQVVAIDGSCGNPCGCHTLITNALGRVRFEGLRLGGVRATAGRVVDGVYDVAQAVARIEQAGQTGFAVLRFAGAGRVRGVVREAGTGNPIHGANVQLRSNSYVRNAWTCSLQQIVSHTTLTEPDGSFEFALVNAGPVQAFASQAFFGANNVASAAGTVVRGQELVLEMSLRNTMAGGLSGTVFLPDGVTKAGAGVEVTVNGMLPDVTVRTDGQGYYEFPEILPEGRYTMTVRDPLTGGVAQQRIYLRAQQDAVHDVRLLGVGTVEVTVADGGDDVVESAQVRVRHTEYPFRTYDGVVEPANQGVVRIEGVVEGPFTVEASDVYGRGGRAPGTIAHPGETVGVRVRLTVTGAVHGHFVMPGGAPIPFGTVRLTSGGRAIGQVTTQGSGEVGSFSFDYVPAGPVRLDAQDPVTARTGLAVGTIESQGQVLALDVRAQALGTVRGRVTGDGTPQPGALVSITSGTYRVNTAADSEGWYEVPGIPEGRITVAASLESGYLRATATGTLTGEGSTLQLDVALHPSGTLRGTVTKADGVTPAAAEVRVMNSGNGFVHHTTPEGGFEFTRVEAGLRSLVADALNSIDRAETTAIVPAGGVVDVPVRLNGVGSLRGRAFGSDGTTPTGGFLAISGRNGFWVQLGPDGLFHFPELLAGPVTATLRVDGNGFSLYGTASGTILPDQETVLDIQVQASGTVTAMVLRAGRTGPAFGAMVTLQHARGTVHTQVQDDGRFTFRGVPLGAFTLLVHDEITNGRAKVGNQQVASNGQTVDLGILELDATSPTLTVLDPVDGSTRAAMGGPITVDLADAESGIDLTSFRVLHPVAAPWLDASAFTFVGGQARGLLRPNWLAVGTNTLLFEVKDLAGNLTQKSVTYTATGATLQGRVLKHDGTPAPGAQVLVDSMSPAVADAQGSYAKRGIRFGRAYVSARDPENGLSSPTETLLFDDGETRTRDFTLPPFGRINGVVRRAGGSLAPNVTVSCCWPLRSVTTSANGAFDLGAFMLGTHSITATDAARGDRGVASVTLTAPGQTATADVRLNGVGTVTVTVRNPDNSVVPGALVRGRSSSVLGWTTDEQATGPDGTRTWTQVLAGNITATARDTARNLAGEATGALSDNGTLALTITLEPAATVTGTVYRAGGTVPASNVDVTITGAANRTVRTDEQGRYTIPNVRLTAFQLVARDPANGDQAHGSGLASAAGSTVTVDMTLRGVGQVQVIVRKANGDPAGGADVFLTPSGELYRRGTTGGDGIISFANVFAGQLAVSAYLPSGLAAGHATATLAPEQSLDVVVTLESVGSIRGRVFEPDGTTPASGATLAVMMPYYAQVYATSDADGRYEFLELPLRSYVVRALVNGRTRAQSPTLTLTTPGQVIVQDLVLVGVGTVSGLVTDPAGNPASGAVVALQSTAGGYYTLATGADGHYSIADVPVGSFTISATHWPLGQRVDSGSSVTHHGHALTLDLRLLSSAVTFPYTLQDGNSLSWYLQADGSVSGGQVVWVGGERAARLTLVENGTPRPFTGSGNSAASEEDKREVVIRQAGLAGLAVTRKVFVPTTGYFIRYLEILENPGSEPVTVDVALESAMGDGNFLPSVVGSADGDNALDPEDDWVLLDDANAEDIYTASTGQLAPLGVSLSGPGGLRPTAASWEGGTRRLTYRWNGVTLLPGQKAAFLHLMTPQADRTRGRASAIRLSQIPPEILLGLTPEEAAAVRNFMVPATLQSSVEPLPPNDGVVSGRLLGGDGQTPVPGGYVYVRSRSPHYGRPVRTLYGAGADGSFLAYATLPPSYVNIIPRTDFDLTATYSFVGANTQTTTIAGRFADAGPRNLSAVVGSVVRVSSGSSAEQGADGRLETYWAAASGDSTLNQRSPYLEVVLPGDATIHEVRARCNTGSPYYLIRRARVEVKAVGEAVLWSADVDLPAETGAVDVPVPAVAGARSVRITSLSDAGAPTLAEVEVIGEGALGPSRTTQQDLSFTGRGVIEGRVLRGDQSAIFNAGVVVTVGSSWKSAQTDVSGQYRFPVVPPGAHTVRADHPLGGHSITVPNVPVVADQKTTQDIVFDNLGQLTVATFSSNGQPVGASSCVTGPGLTRCTPQFGTYTSYTLPDLPAGAYTLTSTDARSQGIVSVPVTISVNTTTTQDITFPPVGTVDVTATVDGQVLYNAPVSWRSAAHPGWVPAGSTNGAGYKRLQNVIGSTFTVRVENPANALAFGETTATMPSEAATVPVSVDVPGLGTVSGTVRALNGEAQPGAGVRALRAADGFQYVAGTANASGVFTLGNVPELPFRLEGSLPIVYAGVWVGSKAERAGALTSHGQTLSLDGLVPRGALAASRSADIWEYTLQQEEAGGILALRQAFAATPALADPRLEVYGPGGSLVASNDDRVTGDKDAEVVFTATQAGAYLAVVKGTGPGGYALGAWAGGLTGNRVFRRYAGVTVTGHVVREISGSAVAGATVLLTATTPGGLSLTASTNSGPDGSYGFESIPANASITVEVVAGGTVVGQATGTAGAVGTTLDLPVTQLSLGQVEVRTTYRGAAFGSVAIEVLSSNPSAPASLAHQTGTTGADGRWIAPSVPVGTITARATDPISGGPLEAAGTLTDGGTLVLELVLTDGGDTTPPATVADLSASVPAPGMVRLSWTAPGDDGTTGTAAAYELRYSTAPIGAGNFGSATVAPAPAPLPAGSGQTFDLTSLSPNTTYYLALKARDEAYNWSPISNVASISTSSLPAGGLKLWLRADAGVTLAGGTSYVSAWQDQSGTNNHALQSTTASQPLFVAGDVNGLPVLRFDGTNDWLSFTTRLTTIRTVFWVVRENPSATNGYRFLLGDVSTYDFCADGARKIWSSSYSSASIQNGETRLNGTLVNGTTTDRPTTMAVVSLVTTGAVTADSFSRDRSYGWHWFGDLAELVIYDRVLSDAERASVEAQLARKYGIYAPPLPAPLVVPNGGTIAGPTTVTLQTEAGAAIRYTIDSTEPTTSSPLYTEPLPVNGRTTLKAKAFASGWSPSPTATATFLASGDFSPASVAGLKLWVRADAGTAGSAAMRVDRWSDQSSQANDLTQSDLFKRPLVLPNAAAGLPALSFDGSNDWLGFTTRLTNIRTVFWVVRESAISTNGYRNLLGDTSNYDFHSDATHKIWDPGYSSASIRNGQTRLNGAIVNGTTTSRPTSMSLISLVTTGPVSASSFSNDRGTPGRHWWGELAELVIYDTALSDADRRAVEEYLAARYGITLP